MQGGAGWLGGGPWPGKEKLTRGYPPRPSRPSLHGHPLQGP